MLTKKEVQYLANLARIKISEQEEEKFQKDISSILDYVKKLEEIDVKGVEPMSHSIAVENVMREDKAERFPGNKVEKLIESAPRKKERHIKVNTILPNGD